MYRSVNGFMGAAAIEVIKQYSFDRAFLGSCGVDMTDFASYYIRSGGWIDQEGGSAEQQT